METLQSVFLISGVPPAISVVQITETPWGVLQAGGSPFQFAWDANFMRFLGWLETYHQMDPEPTKSAIQTHRSPTYILFYI